LQRRSDGAKHRSETSQFVKGSFRMAVRALRLLLRARRQQSEQPPKVYAMAVICEQTYRELDAFYDFVLNDLGADKLKLDILQPTFGGTGPDAFFANNVVANVDELGAIIERCDAKYRLGINPRWLAQVKMYFRSGARGRDETSNSTRAAMATCNRHCGISHSVRRENATLKALESPRDPS